ncbi:FAD-dependent oxidoreductase [Isoptericola cucumis]|uniref:Pyridine nucleotide-disulfide oxidoreductase n=1 Tax=Isoptericola cucumis TaxID=1776856 RepID=A0ABQ2B8I8_9MICO|nr:FAD-dependent oxidoreductase [Isoptericola cucumis]GGI09410.1 pyridine nucleotide-disulfide oxidoreductase [Isoptericola cucumis]
MQRPTIDADLAVVGFGKGGKTLAAAMAGRGARVVMIEQSDQMYGGTCINIGCVPTKSLIYQGEHVDPHTAGEESFRLAAATTRSLTSLMRGKNFAMIDSLDAATVVTGQATFTGPHSLVVRAGDDELEVTATTIVVGTGAEPVLPPIPGLRESNHVVTSTGLLGRTERPRELVVLGGGYVAVELAAMHAAFGARVTLLTRGPRILRHEDDDVATAAAGILADAGVAIRTDVTIDSVADTTTDDGPCARVTYRTADGTTDTVDGDTVLAALGRRPVTDGLGLEAAGVRTDARGAVVVDEHLRTSAEHVFAVGDVNGGPQFTYVSLDDYRIVLDQLVGEGRRSTADRRAVPQAIFMTPPLARVGMTEAEARETGRPLRVAVRRVADMATVPRAKIADPRGLMKAVVDAETDEVLGVTMLSHDAHETINTVALAMRHGVTATRLRDEIYTHPSMTEALNDLFANLA